MLKRYILCASFVIFCLCKHISAQNSWINPVLKEGKPCPDCTLYDVQDNQAKIISLKSLKGKPFILDFFSTGCTSCFASFSKINHLNKDYSGKVKIILVGREDKYIRKAYATFKKRENLEIPHAFDLATVNKFKIISYPYVVWVNAKGIITAVTLSGEISDHNLAAHAMNKSFTHTNRDENMESYSLFDLHKPVTYDNSAWNDSAFFQRSLLMSWKKEMGNAGQPTIEYYARFKNPVQIIGWPLSSLYMLAYTGRLADWLPDDSVYYGKYHYAPIYEMTDSSRFQVDGTSEQNMFCYSQVLARNKRDTGEMLRIMREDLYNAFGYTAIIETRQMPYLRLIKADQNVEQLRSKGGKQIEQVLIDSVNLENAPVSSLISAIADKSSLVSKDLPLIDETGITYPIDLSFVATMTDIHDIIRELPAHGLKIVPGYKEMKVLVIRDKNYSTR